MEYKKIIAIGAVAALLLTGCGAETAKSGSQLLADGKYSAAADAFSEELKSDSKNVKLYIGLADAYVGEGEYEAAVDNLSEGFKTTKSDKIVEKMIQITDDLYKTAADKEEYQTVLYCCEAVLECKDDEAAVYEQKAMCYLHMDQVDKALETVKTGEEKTGSKDIAASVSSYLYTLGSKSYTGGEKAAAKTYYEKVLELDPENTDAQSMIKAIGDVSSDAPKTEEPKKEDTKKEEDKKTEQPKAENKQNNTQTEQKTAASAPSSAPAAQPAPAQKPQQNTQAAAPAPAPQTAKYTVQIGAYAEKQNADNKAAKANAAGFSASISASGGLYHVTIGTFSSQSEANTAAAKAQAAGFNVIVLTD